MSADSKISGLYPSSVKISPGGNSDHLLISGEKIRGGDIFWNNDSYTDFLIPLGDSRVQNLINDAYKIREKYEHLPLQKREQKICEALTRSIEKHFGRYNPYIAAEYDIKRAEEKQDWEKASAARERKNALTKEGKNYGVDKHGDIHQDMWLSGRSEATFGDVKPSSIKEFGQDETVCRHRAGLMSIGASAAGIPNCYAAGYVTWENGDKEAQLHAWVISRQTGNVFESCASPRGSFYQNINQAMLKDSMAGKSSVVQNAYGQYAVYGFGEMAKAPTGWAKWVSWFKGPDRKELARQDNELIAVHSKSAQNSASLLTDDQLSVPSAPSAPSPPIKPAKEAAPVPLPNGDNEKKGHGSTNTSAALMDGLVPHAGGFAVLDVPQGHDQFHPGSTIAVKGVLPKRLNNAEK